MHDDAIVELEEVLESLEVVKVLVLHLGRDCAVEVLHPACDRVSGELLPDAPRYQVLQLQVLIRDDKAPCFRRSLALHAREQLDERLA